MDRTIPRLAEGTELLGPYDGSGLREVPFLVRAPGGRVVQLTRLLYLLASAVDGRRSRDELAARLSRQLGRPVSPGNVEYLLTRKLRPLGILAPAGLAAPAPSASVPSASGPAPLVLPFRLRRALVPARLVSALARALAPLFLPAVVIVAVEALAAFDIWLALEHGIAAGVRHLLLDPVAFLAVTGLLVASAAFHELGHAAACRYGGARPGRLGVGLYVAWPVFYSDVTDSYRLSRGGRLRTDLGGVYFNALVALAAAGVFLLTGWEALTAFVVIQQLQIAQQFLPFVRLDGYYVIADLAGVPDPYGRLKPVLASLVPGRTMPGPAAELTARARRVLAAWALAAIPLLGLNLVMLAVHGPGLFRLIAAAVPLLADGAVAALGRGDVLTALSAGARIVLLLLPAIGLAAVLLRIVHRSVRALARGLPRRRAHDAAAAAPADIETGEARVAGGCVPDMVEVASPPGVLYVTQAGPARSIR